MLRPKIRPPSPEDARDAGALMELWLPQEVIDAMQHEERVATRAQAEAAVDRLQSTITATIPRMADTATEDGARRMAAAIFLMRANTLLTEVRRVGGQLTLQVLGLRSVLELVAVGRFASGERNSSVAEKCSSDVREARRP